MITANYHVTGLTCAHCATAVQTELGTLPGVGSVTVNLNAGGASLVTVISESPVPADVLLTALDEAGGYRLVAGQA